MTSSETQTDGEAPPEAGEAGEADVAEGASTGSAVDIDDPARAAEADAEAAADDDVDEPAPAPAPRAPAQPWWWRNLPRLCAAIATLVGWGFVGWHEHFRVTPPAVFLCLGWLAVIEAVLFLWHTGFSASDDDDGDADWWRPFGERDELEREKRSLLKAIKEIEFDREMGKTSDQDAGEIVRMYRARAIELFKALDAFDKDAGEEVSVKDEIERELRARMALAGGKGKKKGQKTKKGAA
ncbi:MAG TPA: hypothetical protein VL463_04955 [Kofleriaceae bacterium]|jgi:hypothetical protein|nr:hypothetical protein [Kofleriaceae bacterium]